MKNLSIFLLLTTYVLQLCGQVVHVHGGLANSRLDWNFIDHNGLKEQQYRSPVNSYVVGLGVEYLDRGLFSVSSDIYFFQSGGKYTSDEENESFVFLSSDRVSLTYASLSSTINLNPINKGIKLQLFAGPRVDVLLASDKDPLNWIDAREGLAKVNYGFISGAGLSAQLDKIEIGIAGKYLQRFRKLADLEPSINGQTAFGGAEATERTTLLNLSIGYRLK